MISSTLIPVNSPLTHPDYFINLPPYINIHASKRKIVNALSKKHKLSDGVENTLMLFANLAKECGSFEVSQECLVNLRGKSIRTIRNHQSKLADLGLIVVDRLEGWQTKNRVTVLFAQHLNINKAANVTAYLLDPILEDRDINTYYSEYPSIFDNSEKKGDSRFASPSALDGSNRFEEIQRVCLAYLLSQSQIEYVTKQMADKSIVHQGKYLSWLCREAKEGRYMSTREDLGYTKPKNPAKPKAEPESVKVSAEKRLEIKQWAERKALERAKQLGKQRSLTDYEQMKHFDSFVASETLYFEKQAYFKINQKGDRE